MSDAAWCEKTTFHSPIIKCISVYPYLVLVQNFICYVCLFLSYSPYLFVFSSIYSTHVRIAIGSSYIYGRKTAVVILLRQSNSVQVLRVLLVLMSVCVFMNFFVTFHHLFFVLSLIIEQLCFASCIVKGPCHLLICLDVATALELAFLLVLWRGFLQPWTDFFFNCLVLHWTFF